MIQLPIFAAIIKAARIGKSPGEKSLDDHVGDAILRFAAIVCLAVGAWLVWKAIR